jgi:hypothetical protein
MALWILLNYSVFDNAVDNLSKKQKKKKEYCVGTLRLGSQTSPTTPSRSSKTKQKNYNPCHLLKTVNYYHCTNKQS